VSQPRCRSSCSLHCYEWQVQNISGELTTYSCGIPINACGAWSGLIMQMAGISDWVVVPKLRSMFFVHCPAATCVHIGELFCLVGLSHLNVRA